MSMQTLAEPVVVWMSANGPARVVWRGVRYRVTDRPTPLRERVAAPGMTHPVEPQVGWRFQGTDDHGQSYVFDVRRDGDQSWELTAVYE